MHAPAPKKTHPFVVFVALVLLACLVGLFVLRGACYALFLYEIEVPLAEGDRAAVLTAEELAPYRPGHVLDERRARLKKVRLLDGSGKLEYEYDGVDVETPLYVYSSVVYEPKASDARLAFSAMDVGISVGVGLEKGSRLSRAPCGFELGLKSQSRCTNLTIEGAPIGTIISVLEGRRALLFHVSGLVLDDPEIVRALLGPKIDRARAWKPE